MISISNGSESNLRSGWAPFVLTWIEKMGVPGARLLPDSDRSTQIKRINPCSAVDALIFFLFKSGRFPGANFKNVVFSGVHRMVN